LRVMRKRDWTLVSLTPRVSSTHERDGSRALR
jgi:hypothetical protein